MSTRVSIFAAATALLSLFALGCDTEGTSSSRKPESTRYIVPEAGEGIALASRADASISIRAKDEAPEPKVAVPERYLVSQVMNHNLDVDESEEQIIVYKDTASREDRIKLLLADFDTVRSSYVQAWKGETQASNVRTFAVYLKDLVGDHKLELVCFGMNNEGRQTLDVFRRTNSPSGFGLYYESVASISADASIEIEETERSEAYDSIQTTGQSFPISVYSRNVQSDNELDLTKTTYYWSHQQNRYVKGSAEEIPGGQIEEEQLSALYDGDAETIERYLDGPWYRSSGTEDASGSRELAFFDRDEGRIVLFSGDTQKSYVWVNSYKTIYRGGPGLWINVRNESIETLRRQISVAVLAIDEIRITLKSDTSWNGTYRKLSADLQESLLRSVRSGAVTIPELQLQGLYRNESGTEIFFSSRSRFTMRQDDETNSGGYSLYEVGASGATPTTVLELMILSENGLVSNTRVYQLSYSEQKSSERIIRTLRLTPAVVRVKGVETTSSDTLILEQVEELEDEEESAEEGRSEEAAGSQSANNGAQ